MEPKKPQVTKEGQMLATAGDKLFNHLKSCTQVFLFIEGQKLVHVSARIKHIRLGTHCETLTHILHCVSIISSFGYIR